MPTQCSQDSLDFGTVEGRQVVASFDGGAMTSDAGALLLGQADKAIGLVARFAACFIDARCPELIEHSIETHGEAAEANDLAKLPPGTREDGGGVRLVVEANSEGGKPGPRRWVLRVTINGQRRNRGLGSYPLVTLDMARDKATDIRRAARDGRDLIRALKEQRAKMVTFRNAFEACYENREKTLSNRKHRQQWTSTMETYVYQKIGNLVVSDVTPAHILAILQPIWFKKAPTILQRLELVFKSATVLGQLEKPSPCLGIRQQLGTGHVDIEHLRALL
jgi:Phage integrase central domain/Arm DNA-binding domain/Transposase DDE domain group 1